MSHDSDTAARPDVSTPPSTDHPATDSNFELLEEPDDTLLRTNEEHMYWYASSDSSEQFGPVSSVELRKQISSGAIESDFLVWRNGMQQWTRIPDHFDISSNQSFDPKGCFPPPFPDRSGRFRMSELLDFVGNWQPTAYLLHCLARFTFAFGMLLIVLSLVLVPFGISWFSGGFQIVLIGAVLELTALVRSVFPSSAVARDAIATSDSTREQTEDIQDIAEGQLPR